jgi:hypothetical protein
MDCIAAIHLRATSSAACSPLLTLSLTGPSSSSSRPCQVTTMSPSQDDLETNGSTLGR